MARKEPYWAAYLPSWRKKDWNKPAEIKIHEDPTPSSSVYNDPRCENCTCSCSHCPYSK